MPQWRKPSGRCSLHVDDQCVEVTGGLVPHQIAVRDSKNPDTSLIFTRQIGAVRVVKVESKGKANRRVRVRLDG